MNLSFESAWFKNFLSFGNLLTTVDLSRSGTTLIVGENLDEGGSSGAGKTTILNVISYVIYDKIPRDDVKKDKLINNINNGKSVTMEAGVVLKAGADNYEISRRRGHDSGVKLVKNGVDITPDSIANFNAAVEEIVGFSYNLFSQIILFNGSSTPFLSLSGPQQRELIEELLRITILSRKAEALKLKMSATESELKIQLALLDQQKRQADKHKEMIALANKRVSDWEAQHAAEIARQEQTLTMLKSVDFEAEEQLHKMIADIKAQLIPFDKDIVALEHERKALKAKTWPKSSQHAVSVSQLATAQRDSKKLSDELTHLQEAKCPYCLQKFKDAQAKLTEVSEKLNASTELVVTLTANIAGLVADKEAFNDESSSQLSILDEAMKELEASRSGLSEQAAELTTVLTYKTYKDHVNAASMAVTVTEKIAGLISQVNPHVDALGALTQDKSYAPDTAILDGLAHLKEHQKILHKLLTDKNSFIRKGIIGKTLPFLNKRIAYYTERLGLPHIVVFQPDMTCEITRHGLDLSHGNLSNGEQKRLNLGLCFAFRDALTYLHSKVNLLLTDEVDGGSLDEQSVSAIITLLKHKAWDDKVGIFIISHRPEFDGRCDRNLIVRKESGFSSLIKQVD